MDMEADFELRFTLTYRYTIPDDAYGKVHDGWLLGRCASNKNWYVNWGEMKILLPAEPGTYPLLKASLANFSVSGAKLVVKALQTIDRSCKTEANKSIQVLQLL